MGRPATMFFWRGRGFAPDAAGKRTVLVKRPRTTDNRELAARRLAHLLGQRDDPAPAARHEPDRPSPDAGTTVGEVIDRFLADGTDRVRAGELKPNTLAL